MTGSITMRGRISFGPWSPPRLCPVLHLVGRMLLALSAAMLLRALSDLVVSNPDWKAFMLASGVTSPDVLSRSVTKGINQIWDRL
jgi:trk system potassium uptake protein TrkH